MADPVALSVAPTSNPAVPKYGERFVITASLIVSEAGKLTAGFSRQGTDRTPQVTEDVTADQTVQVTRQFDPLEASDAGKYELWVTFDGADVNVGAEPVNVQNDDGEPPAPPPSTDLRGLVWDPEFAANTGGVAALALAAVLAAAITGAMFLVSKSFTPDDVAGVVSLLGVAIAAIAITGGVWVVVLELRGRATEPKSTDPTAVEGAEESSKGITPAGIEATAKVFDALAKLRTPIAALAVGGAIFVASAVLAGSVASDGAPTSTTTTTTTPVGGG